MKWLPSSTNEYNGQEKMTSFGFYVEITPTQAHHVVTLELLLHYFCCVLDLLK